MDTRPVQKKSLMRSTPGAGKATSTPTEHIETQQKSLKFFGIFFCMHDFSIFIGNVAIVASSHLGLSGNRVYSQWNSHFS